MSNFIENTAKDYDMDIETVESLYHKYSPDYRLFYEKLEEYIKERKERH